MQLFGQDHTRTQAQFWDDYTMNASSTNAKWHQILEKFLTTQSKIFLGSS